MKIKCVNGRIEIPFEFQISETKRRLHVKTPWMNWIDTLDKDNFRVTTQRWFRQKGKDKPYINEGLVSIDGFIYEVEEVKEDVIDKELFNEIEKIRFKFRIYQKELSEDDFEDYPEDLDIEEDEE